MPEIAETLNAKTADELRILAKKLSVTGYSALNKTELVLRLSTVDPAALEAELFPTWWQTYHNHVYGIVSAIGVALSILFFAWPSSAPPVASVQTAHRTVETPIAFYDYAALPPAEKKKMFAERQHQQFTWEGYVVKYSGYDPNSIYGLKFGHAVSIFIVPTSANSPQLEVECSFGVIEQTDWGVEFAQQLHLMNIGQRIRCSGTLKGTPDDPVLEESYFEAVFPLGE